jgi:hypothetical protein
MFSNHGILNLRIKLHNEIYFRKHNTMDKAVVYEFFGDA